MLVMIANDGEDEMEGMERLADVFAGNGMELHDLPFGRGEVAALLQDFIGDGDFAEVVKVSAAFQSDQRILVHAEVAAELNGVNGKSFAVALGVRIAALDDQS